MHRYRIYYKKLWVIYCSFIVAMILHIVTFLPGIWYFQPSWMMMLLIYWITILPNKVNIGTGFILGLMMDIILGSIVGVHALSFSTLTYLAIRKIYFFQYMSIWQQSIIIMCFSMIHHSIKYLIKFLITKILYNPEIFWNCILDGGIWPFLTILMSKIHQYLIEY